MKKRLTLVLTELAIMLLVAAVASAICLSAFAKARSISKENALRDRAYTQMQSMAELFKHHGGDINAVASAYGRSAQDILTVEQDDITLTLTVTEWEGYIAEGVIVAASTDGEEIGRLSILTQGEVPQP